jgi:hypothetical protein
MDPLIFFLIFAVVAIAAAIYGGIQTRKRQEGMTGLARQLGLDFNPRENYSLPDEYFFLDRLDQGSNQYAFNILSGTYQGHDLKAFDFHYETHSTDSKGNRRTHHHYFSFFILNLPLTFPELTIAREGVFSKIAQAVGYDDIDFESAEFSRRFCVRSKDKKFAYDVCNAQMIEYLLTNPDLTIEVDGYALALAFDSRLSVEKVSRNLDRLIEVRQRLPTYLFETRT